MINKLYVNQCSMALSIMILEYW